MAGGNNNHGNHGGQGGNQNQGGKNKGEKHNALQGLISSALEGQAQTKWGGDIANAFLDLDPVKALLGATSPATIDSLERLAGFLSGTVGFVAAGIAQRLAPGRPGVKEATQEVVMAVSSKILERAKTLKDQGTIPTDDQVRQAAREAIQSGVDGAVQAKFVLVLDGPDMVVHHRRCNSWLHVSPSQRTDVTRALLMEEVAGGRVVHFHPGCEQSVDRQLAAEKAAPKAADDKVEEHPALIRRMEPYAENHAAYMLVATWLAKPRHTDAEVQADKSKKVANDAHAVYRVKFKQVNKLTDMVMLLTTVKQALAGLASTATPDEKRKSVDAAADSVYVAIDASLDTNAAARVEKVLAEIGGGLTSSFSQAFGGIQKKEKPKREIWGSTFLGSLASAIFGRND